MAALGWQAMPWQAEHLDVLGELVPFEEVRDLFSAESDLVEVDFDRIDNGLLVPAYRSPFWTTPRQAGKTSMAFGLMADRALNWRDRGLQLTGWTAQDQSSARKKLLLEVVPRLEASDLAKFVRQINRGKGEEAIHWRTGASTILLASTVSAGHGLTLTGGAFVDEIWDDTDSRRAQSLGPAQSTVVDAQQWTTSTAGTERSVVYNRLRRQGRQAVADDAGYGMCYLEYSAPDDWDEEDTDTLRTFHPALGHTITAAVIEQQRKELEDSPGEYRRAYGNVPISSVGDLVVDFDLWERVCSDRVRPDGLITFAIAVSDDRSSAAIAAADSAGNVELVEHRQGVAWVVGRSNALTETHRARVVLDKAGPAAALLAQPNLLNVDALGTAEVVRACGGFLDAVVEASGIAVRSAPSLDTAIKAVVKRTVGDGGFVWSRRASSGDVSPLEAASFAWSEARRAEAPADPQFLAL